MVTPGFISPTTIGELAAPSSIHLTTTRRVSTRDREHNQRIFLNELDIIIGKRPILCLVKKPTPVYSRTL
jgi:hypothetical protein